MIIWVFIKVEVSTDGGLAGHYWLRKAHKFPTLPPIGYELDYRHRTRETVILDRVLMTPESEALTAYQNAWFAFGVGELVLWESAGWEKLEMAPEDKAPRTKEAKGK